MFVPLAVCTSICIFHTVPLRLKNNSRFQSDNWKSDFGSNPIRKKRPNPVKIILWSDSQTTGRCNPDQLNA